MDFKNVSTEILTSRVYSY